MDFIYAELMIFPMEVGAKYPMIPNFAILMQKYEK